MFGPMTQIVDRYEDFKVKKPLYHKKDLHKTHFTLTSTFHGNYIRMDKVIRNLGVLCPVCVWLQTQDFMGILATNSKIRKM